MTGAAVIVYDMPDCPACSFTKSWLDRKGVRYEVQSALSERGRALAAENGFTAAPIVEAGGKCWSGFRPDLIQEYLTEHANIS